MSDARDVEHLLYEEARCIDEHRLDDWLELFTGDAVYWVPAGPEDPSREPSIIYDDRSRMEERVFRLTKTPAHAQSPPSQTVHVVSNVQVGFLHREIRRAVARCALVVHEMRVGDTTQVGLGVPRSFAGRCEYTLVQSSGHWLIEKKIVRLLNREQPLYNMTFII